MIALLRWSSILLFSCGAVSLGADEPASRVVVQQVGGFDTNVFTGGARRGIALHGDFAYLCGDRLYVLDVSQPRTPRAIGSCVLPAAARDVALAGWVD